jgi:hypothetical protein
MPLLVEGEKAQAVVFALGFDQSAPHHLAASLQSKWAVTPPDLLAMRRRPPKPRISDLG